MSATLEQRISVEDLAAIMRTYRDYLIQNCEHHYDFCSLSLHCEECFIKDYKKGKINFIMKEEDTEWAKLIEEETEYEY